ncbi:MAG: hypothetical protein LAP87_29315 [Acidobacteriia bacterium]|nr:hypothetical protein [Terriglobia bacterium]
MTYDDVFQVVRVNIATMTGRYSIDQISGPSKLAEVDITDAQAIRKLTRRTFRALNGRRLGRAERKHFVSLMNIKPNTTVNQAARAAFQASRKTFALAGNDPTQIKGLKGIKI